MNMQPVIDRAVVHTFTALLGQWMVWTGLLVVVAVLIRWLLTVIGGESNPPLSSSVWRQPFRSAWRAVCHRVGRTPKERALLWWGLGLLWILDGVLQAQPAMPNNGFVQDVLAPALIGQPSWYIRILGWNIQFWTNHPVGADVMATLLQVWIGILLLVCMDRFWGRVALWVSIFWGIGIWFLGEGMGGILTGHITWLTGAPGSVVFYVVGAVLLLLPEDWWTSGRVQKRIRSGLGVFWLTVAIAQAWPAAGFWQGSTLSQIFAAAAGMPQPFYVADPIAVMETAASLNPAIWNAVFVTIMLGLGVLYLSNVPSRFVAGLTLSWLLFSWWMGQDFGVMGGIGTDPNSSPVMALLLLATWQMRWKRTTTPLTPSK